MEILRKLRAVRNTNAQVNTFIQAEIMCNITRKYFSYDSFYYQYLNISASSTYEKIEIGECSVRCGDGFRNETTYECKARSNSLHGCEITEIISRTCTGASKCPGKSDALS